MNQQIEMYVGDGIYDIPMVRAFHGELPDKWISFNFALKCKDPQNTGVHFFLDDYQFERVWHDPRKYVDMLRRFKAVAQTDFSLYRDFPKALQIYNLFRNCWLANYWIDRGVNVIPSPSWSDIDSHSYSFPCYEPGGIFMISTVGVLYDKETFGYFMNGWNEMQNQLHPDLVLVHGQIPNGLNGNIRRVQSYQEYLHTLDGRKK